MYDGHISFRDSVHPSRLFVTGISIANSIIFSL